MLTSWREKRGGIIGPDERLPWGGTVAMGFQHVLAMFGATVVAPLVMGFDPNLAILFSGIGTLIFFAIVGGRVPSYLGFELRLHRAGGGGRRGGGDGGVRRRGHPPGSGRDYRRRGGLHPDRGAGPCGRIGLDRRADAAAGDRGGGRDHRAQSRIRRQGPGQQRRLHRHRHHPRHPDYRADHWGVDQPPADPAGDGRRVRRRAGAGRDERLRAGLRLLHGARGRVRSGSGGRLVRLAGLGLAGVLLERDRADRSGRGRAGGREHRPHQGGLGA